MSLDWLAPTLLAWTVLVLPGCLVLRCAGVRHPGLLGAGPVITVLLVVVIGAVDVIPGIGWTPLSAAVQLLLVLALLLGARWALRVIRRRRAAARSDQAGADQAGADGQVLVGSWRARDLIPAAVSMLVGTALAASAQRGMGGIGTLNGSYDAFFHIAALQFIRADHSAFLMTALQGIYGEPTFYPAAWDVLTALLPYDAVTSANAMVLAMLIALPASLAAMMALLLGPGTGEGHAASERRMLTSFAAACAPMFLSVPVIVLVLGLWPSALGALCLPVALGALWRLGTAIMPLGRRTLRHLWRHPHLVVLPCALLAGAVLAHPANVFSLAVAPLAAVIARALVLMGRARTRRRGALLFGAVSAALLLYAAGSAVLFAKMDLTVKSPWSWPAQVISILIDRPRLTVLPVQPWAVLVLWVLAAIGAIWALRVRSMLGATAVVLATITIALSILTNASSPVARIWVYPWYGARERIAPLLMCALVVLGGIGLRTLARRAREGSRRRPLTAAIVLVAASTVVTLAVPQRFGFIGSLAYTAYGVQFAPYVTPRERAFIERTAAELPPDAVVIGNPRDGEALYWSLGGVTTVFPTLSEPQTLDSRRVARYVYQAGYNPDVCTSLHEVGPTHLYVDTSAESGALISPSSAVLFSGLERIPPGHLELVDRDGPYALYRIEPLC